MHAAAAMKRGLERMVSPLCDHLTRTPLTAALCVLVNRKPLTEASRRMHELCNLKLMLEALVNITIKADRVGQVATERPQLTYFTNAIEFGMQFIYNDYIFMYFKFVSTNRSHNYTFSCLSLRMPHSGYESNN